VRHADADPGILAERSSDWQRIDKHDCNRMRLHRLDVGWSSHGIHRTRISSQGTCMSATKRKETEHRFVSGVPSVISGGMEV